MSAKTRSGQRCSPALPRSRPMKRLLLPGSGLEGPRKHVPRAGGRSREARPNRQFLKQAVVLRENTMIGVAYSGPPRLRRGLPVDASAIPRARGPVPQSHEPSGASVRDNTSMFAPCSRRVPLFEPHLGLRHVFSRRVGRGITNGFDPFLVLSRRTAGQARVIADGSSWNCGDRGRGIAEPWSCYRKPETGLSPCRLSESRVR